MNLTRREIVSILHDRLVSNPKVLALWLEGADATNTVDEYSDIDICCSVEKGAIIEVADHVREALESISVIDLVESSGAEEDHQHIVFHLAGTSEYLLLDLDLFVGRGSTFAEADEIEKPLILFDKASLIRYVDREEYLGRSKNEQRINKLMHMIAQSCRIDKYVKRGQFLEAYGYYHRWLLEPLVEMLRMRYTPLHPDYYIVHISRHLPIDIRARLEELFKVNSVEEIEAKSKEALLFFNEVAAEVLKN